MEHLWLIVALLIGGFAGWVARTWVPTEEKKLIAALKAGKADVVNTVDGVGKDIVKRLGKT